MTTNRLQELTQMAKEKSAKKKTVTRDGAEKHPDYKPVSGQWISKVDRLAIYIRDNFMCLYCGTNLRDTDPAKEMSLDHLLPRVSGGNNESTNLITACRACNCSRQTQPWMDYCTGGAVERINTQRYKTINKVLAKALINGTAYNPESETR